MACDDFSISFAYTHCIPYLAKTWEKAPVPANKSMQVQVERVIINGWWDERNGAWNTLVWFLFYINDDDVDGD